jgi:predicted nucleic acid-binding Zn ribbon protein
MSLTPISRVTTAIQSQPGWEGVRDWGAIVRAWHTIVSPSIAERTRVRSLSGSAILTIATASSSLAHQLTFGRQGLCRQLNAQLVSPIKDLRFVALGTTGDRLVATEDLAVAIGSGEIVNCDRCECRARAGELQRWGFCQFCAIDLGILGKR